MKRNTWQREAVRDALERTDGFVSAQALHASLRGTGSEVGLATVYRALADLESEGEADSLVQEGESLYRACTPGSHHHHLICRSCGDTRELEASIVEQWASNVGAEHGYSDIDHVVDLFGVCGRCRALSGDK